MAMSSILHNFIITDEDAAKRLLDALDEASKEPEWKTDTSIEINYLRDSKAIKALLAKRKNNGY